MKYDFETMVDRKNQGSEKWEMMYRMKPDVKEGVVPLSVADMEFKNAPEIINGLKDYLDKTILGYTTGTDKFYNSVINWMKRRHDFEIEKEWIVNTSGIVPAFFNAIRTFSNVGDGVIIMSPVYYPFYRAIKLQNREIVDCQLIEKDGYYTINYELIEELAKESKNKILLFCSPHNPVGRVWKKEELEKVAEIVLKYDLLLLSDEIHHDLIMPVYKHTVFQTISDELAEKTITFTAPSKSFNLAGMNLSNVIIKNKEIRDVFIKGLEEVNGGTFTALGYKSCEIAYNECEEWFEECLSVIDKNQRLLKEFFDTNFPNIKSRYIEGTYLQWVDFRALNLTNDELENLMVQEADLFLDEGYIFGEAGSGFERFNLAVPTKVLEESLNRLKNVLEKRIKNQ